MEIVNGYACATCAQAEHARSAPPPEAQSAPLALGASPAAVHASSGVQAVQETAEPTPKAALQPGQGVFVDLVA